MNPESHPVHLDGGRVVGCGVGCRFDYVAAASRFQHQNTFKPVHVHHENNQHNLLMYRSSTENITQCRREDNRLLLSHNQSLKNKK